MSDQRLRELVTSPPELRQRRPWWPFVAGVVAAVMVVTVIVLGASTSDEDQQSDTTVPAAAPGPSTTTPPTTAPRPDPFPPGYVPISDVEAFKPHAVVTYADRIAIAMSSLAPRETPATDRAWFIGGSWELDIADGASIRSDTTLFDDAAPGGFAVTFPIPPGTEVQPTGIRLVDRWQPVETVASFEAPMVGDPDTLDWAETVQVGGFTLRFDARELVGSWYGVRYWEVTFPLAQAAWALEGDAGPAGLSLTVELIGPNNRVVVVAGPPPYSIRPFGLDAAHGNVTAAITEPNLMPWSEARAAALADDLATVERVVITVTLTTGRQQAVDTPVIDLTGVPIYESGT